MEIKKNKKLLFFGELPKISMNGIAINNLKLLAYMKIKFNETFYVQDLPHKNISSYLKTFIRLFYSLYLISKEKNLTVYFTLSHGNIGIFKTIVGYPVLAHRVDVTAESTPPETPITKPLKDVFSK